MLVPEDSVRLHVVPPSQRQNAVSQIHAAQGVLNAFGLQEDAVPFDHLSKHDTAGKISQQSAQTEARDVGNIQFGLFASVNWERVRIKARTTAHNPRDGYSATGGGRPAALC